jgi:hypothetical protein
MAKSSPVFRPKDRITHSVFGLGTIVDVNDRHTTIAFDETGTRKFMTTMVKLLSSDAPPPARPVRKKKTSPREVREKAAKKAAKKATKKTTKKTAKKTAKKTTKKATKKAATKKK